MILDWVRLPSLLLRVTDLRAPGIFFYKFTSRGSFLPPVSRLTINTADGVCVKRNMDGSRIELHRWGAAESERPLSCGCRRFPCSSAARAILAGVVELRHTRRFVREKARCNPPTCIQCSIFRPSKSLNRAIALCNSFVHSHLIRSRSSSTIFHSDTT